MRQVIIHLNTTGTQISDGHRIIEIAAIELINRNITGKFFHVYLNPFRTIDERQISTHGITNEFLENKPRFHDISKEFTDFIDSVEIIAFNRKTIDFIENEFSLLGSEFSKSDRIYCQDIAKKLNKNSGSIETLSKTLGVKKTLELDSALENAEILSEIYLHLTPNEHVVTSFSDFHSKVDGISRSALCRGVSDKNHNLLPSLFRHKENTGEDTREHNLMWIFKTHAKAHLERTPENNLEWLTVAQHHGLPTRLLDWSLSPLVACFFAVQSNSKKHGAIYIYDIGTFKKEEDINIKTLTKPVAFFPSHATKRVTAQSGMFTLHPTCHQEIDSSKIKKIIIPSTKKSSFTDTLAKYGIHHGTMFPDLDGLSLYIRYLNKY